jgi:hypothetical protein
VTPAQGKWLATGLIVVVLGAITVLLWMRMRV